MSRKLLSSPLRHEGSPPELNHSMKSPEHAEWHRTHSTIEDSPEYIEQQKLIEEKKKKQAAIELKKKLEEEKALKEKENIKREKEEVIA